MRFGVFYEHQLPRPWASDDEHRLLTDALEQIELADRLGIDYAWEVEHHFLEEYSHSSAPEVFLAAASQRTKQIRLGHGIVHALPAVNHPARIAERVATLDLVSDGRVDFGTGESSSAAELGGFGVPREDKRAIWAETLDAVTRMFVEHPFPGYQGRYLTMPPRTIVPRPLQQPHPPLWVACSRRETILLAARSGIGALSFSFVEPEDAARWVTEYYELICSDECVPRGFAVNANIAIVLPMMMHPDEQTAIERGIDGAHFFGYSLSHFYGGGPHAVGKTDLWQSFAANRAESGFARDIVSPDAAPLAVRLLQAGTGSLRGAIGTPAQVTDLLARYEAVGIDQVIFVMQSGKNRHEHICESLELFASQVLPAFAEGREKAESAKADRLVAATEAALARRSPARSLETPYTIDEAAEVAAAAAPARRHRQASLGSRAAEAGGRAATALRQQADAGTKHLVSRASDARLEQLFGSTRAQRVIFARMAARFDPAKSAGFAGSIRYNLGLSDGTKASWTIKVQGGKAAALSAADGQAAVTIGLPLTDFVRATFSGESFLPLIAAGTMTIDGDLAVASRLTEMFGGRSAY
jgi:alkanesulfonate monooxygenase SsuD/methylene tetrahydromethanopterin reductase-like flavin-dependent oxidoreductase (luciferase family)